MSGILGVDPGVSGALALYRPDLRQSWTIIDLPPKIEVLQYWLAQWNPSVCFLERTFRNEKLVEHTGWLRGVIESSHIPVVRVGAAAWKRHFDLLKSDKRASLNRAREIVGKNAPELSLVKHHNRAEAALIAYYGASKYGELV